MHLQGKSATMGAWQLVFVNRDGRRLRRYKLMEPMYLSIRQKETGQQIKKLLAEKGYTVKDVQIAMGFENPQAIYKWLSGRSLPSLDNFVILSRLLHTSMEDILVVDGDVVRFGARLNCWYNDKHLMMY
jgi:hypothetical protein